MRNIKLSVIGLGKLGLPLAALLGANGNSVRGYDKDDDLRELLRNKKFYSSEPDLMEILKKSDGNLIVVDSIAEAISDSQIIFIIVPTPSLESGHFSNEYILEVIKEIGLVIKNGNKVVIDIVSTVMPGSCEGEIKSLLEACSVRKIGPDLGLCYNPEFIALGSVINDMQNPDMHLIGESSNWAGELVRRALQSIVKKEVPTMKLNLTEAELVKISVNNFVTMKISFANILMQSASALKNINIDAVTSAIGLDTRVGSKYLKAAAPYGGPCFPRDTRALSAFLEDLGINSALSNATESVNKSHLDYIINLITETVEKESVIGVVGLSYKIGTSVIDESPGSLIVSKLITKGYKIKVWDDEGANIQTNLITESLEILDSGEELIEQSDFIVITRILKSESRFFANLIQSNKRYLDLWRQF